ncbi:uncharacterized protein LOC135486827 [Lineus longissimus]|uniref:uncharacterized protein LOC135486827 n=1 Tax=Lineus longissimus TaxID=88925 RepID=UPI00315C65FB
MDSENRSHLVKGTLSLDATPEVPSRVIKVFLSSTSTDMLQERNLLVENVYPKLREYCREKYGLEFEVVDPRWGIKDETFDDHSFTERSLAQLQDCCSSSPGPYFVALIGQKYGRRPLPAAIRSDLYENMKTLLRRHRSRETRDAGLLDQWYRRDENAVPPVYRLQPISSRFPRFISKDAVEMQTAKKCWEETEVVLKRLVKKGLELCVIDGKLDDYSRHQLVMSDLEREVQLCMMQQGDPSENCLVFYRNIEDLKNYMDHERASKFMEVVYNEKEEKIEEDLECQNLLRDLKERKIKTQWIKGNGVEERSVLWRFDNGINPKLHEQYLTAFSTSFLEKMTNLIDIHAARLSKGCDDALLDEISAHLCVMKAKASDCSMRDSTLDDIKEYLCGKSSSPLTLFGEAGVGKATLMAAAHLQVLDWLGDDTHVISRIVGLTTVSSNIRDILLTVCQQLMTILSQETSTLPKNAKGLQSCFQELLDQFPSSKNLVIMFSSLERLAPDDNAHFMGWLPISLKENVKIILSTLPETHGLLNRLQTEIYSDSCSYLEVLPLSSDACLSLVSDWLENDERTLSEEQQDTLGYVFQSCSSPTFARLICAEAKTWPSWFAPSEGQCFKTMEECAGNMFDLLEAHYGKAVIEKTLAYLIAADTGLSDCEIVDLLSLDDDVLAEVYKTWHPPVRRCPPMLWLMIKSDISTFLTIRDRDGVTLCDFNHTLIRDIATKRYLSDESLKKNIHFNLADYFLGNWHGKKKPFLIPKTLIEMKKLPVSAAEADRLVPAQPLTFRISGGFNRRKYDQVPRHLYLSGRLDELNMLVLFNYEWLYNKAKALSLQHILQDFSLNPSVEAQLVEEALRSGQAIIEANINNMAAELVGRLLSYYQSHQLIRELINQSDKTGLKHSALIPAYPYHQTPGSPLQFTLNCETAMDFFHISNDGRYLMCKKIDRSIVRVFDLATGEHKTDIPVSVGDLHVTPDGKYFVLVDHVTRMAVKIHDAESGKFIGQLIPANHISLTPREKYTLEKISISNDYICLLVSAETSFVCIADLKTCKFLHIVGLESKGNVCEIMPDNMFVVCNAGPNILSYNLQTLEHVGSARYEKKPMMIVFTSDGSRGFWIDGVENKVTVMHLKNGCVEMSYRIVLDHSMPMDRVSHIEVSNEDKYLMVRGTNNILAYDIRGEKVVVRCQRPHDIPKEFRLPQSHSVDMCFTHAAFSRDNKYLIGSIFRNVYIWHVSGGQLATTLQAPVGVIKRIIVNKHNSQIISYLDQHPAIHVWNVEDAMYDIGILDKLTRDIVEVQVTKDDKTSFVRCRNSDEVGVIDMNTGTLTDLLTHDGVVTNLSITPDGQYAFVATDTRKPNVTNKVWYVPERRLVYEFGSEPAFGVSTFNGDSIYVMYNHNTEGHQPTFIKKLCLDEDTVREINYTNTANRALGRPFLSPDDQRLVILTEADGGGVFDSKIISVFKLCKDYSHTMDAITISPDHLQTFVNVKRILDARPCYYKPTILIILYDTQEKVENGMMNVGSGYCKGLLLMDLETETVAHVCDSFLSPSTPIDSSLLFSKDMRICLDKESNIYDIETGFFLNQLHPEGKQPIGLTLGGTVAIFHDKREVYALRIDDCAEIARCNIQGDITCVTIGHDEHTIVIGCADGRVVSHVIIDEQREQKSAIMKQIARRRFPLSDGRASSRSWDKVDTASDPPYSRPTSGISLGIVDKELLRKVKPVPRIRPKSDTLLYLNPKTSVCSVMSNFSSPVNRKDTRDRIRMWLRMSIFVVFALGAAQAHSILADRFLFRKKRDVSAGPDIRYLYIKTDVAYRFATTKVASLLANKARKSREAVFTIELPKSAFITEFSMTIENIVYNGTVKAKEVARKEYIEAKRRGQSVGHVAAKTRDANTFDVSVNVAPQQKVTFNLTYQELLQRTLGMYQNVMYINPGQIVPDLKVDVFINESRNITTIRVPELKRDVEESINSLEDNPIAVVDKSSPTSAHISYYPSIDQQNVINENGLTGQFIVQYDVARDFDGGDIQVVDGYFVHFFAPTGLQPVKKNVIFILDISGSMSGRKIQQVKDAMKVILDDLQPGDLFNIILFDSQIEFWNKTNLLEATEENIDAAKSYVLNMETRGSTNINSALIDAIGFLDDMRNDEKAMNPSSIIVFLTDGDPTSGVTNIDRILENVRTANEDRYSIFSLGFGEGVDFGFLRKISLQNSGIARKIYADSDATLQLQDFYKEICAPLLTDVNVDYLDIDNTTKVTRRVFPNYFNGSEIVICGTYTPRVESGPRFRAVVQGKSNGNSIIIEKELDVRSKTGIRASTEKLWAYLTIKEMLDKMQCATNETNKKEMKAEALRLSLKYSFVTPLTSMIVKKPDQNATRTDTEDEEVEAVEEAADLRPSRYSSSSGYGGSSGRSSYAVPNSAYGGYGAGAPALGLPIPRRKYASYPYGGRPAPTYMPMLVATMMSFLTTTTTTPATTTTVPTTTAKPKPRVPTTRVTIMGGSPSLMVEVTGRYFCINWPITAGKMHTLFRDSKKQTVILGEFEDSNGFVGLKHIIIRNEATGEELVIDSQTISNNFASQIQIFTWENAQSDQMISMVDTNTITVPKHSLSNCISLDIVRKQRNNDHYLVLKINWRRRSRVGLSGLLRNFVLATMSSTGLNTRSAGLTPGTGNQGAMRVEDISGQQRTCKLYARV